MNEIEKHILKKFMYNSKLQYNEIWDKFCESNKFNYHLQKIIKSDLLEKKGDFYSLTSLGRHHISSLDGITFNQNLKPIVCAFILCYEPKENKVLMNLRKKQPFLDYLGIPGGKIDFGVETKKQAEIELLEETGISAKLELATIVNFITIDENDNKPTHHMIGFNFLGTEIKGELIKKNREGENFFINTNDISKYNYYPDIPYTIKDLIEFYNAKNKTIKYREIKRKVKDELFTGMEFIF